MVTIGRVLYVRDAVIQTGFERLGHNVTVQLQKIGWYVSVLGLNAIGDPHEYPYKIYRADAAGDALGANRLKHVCGLERPDVVLLQNDAWHLPKYLAQMPKGVPVVAYIPVDAPNQEGARYLGGLTRAIAYTEFGKQELIASGLPCPCDVIGHGIDLSIYAPAEGDHQQAREHARQQLGLNLPAGAFVTLNVNRNAPRKRLDLTIQYWTQWWQEAGRPENAFLYIHAADQGAWSLRQLAGYFGIAKQFRITDPSMTIEYSLHEKFMPLVYQTADVQLTTTGGEGWGLTTMEGMACVIPQICPSYAALPEWALDGVLWTEVDHYAATIQGINTIAGFPGVRSTVTMLQYAYENPQMREAIGAEGRRWVEAPRFSWESVGQKFSDVLTGVISVKPRTPMGVSLPSSEASHGQPHASKSQGNLVGRDGARETVDTETA